MAVAACSTFGVESPRQLYAEDERAAEDNPMVLKAPTESEQPGDIARYFDRQGLYQTEFDGRVPVYIRLAVRTEYGELRSLVLPLLSWVPAERVEVLS